MRTAYQVATQVHLLSRYVTAAFNRMPWMQNELLMSTKNYWQLLCYLYVNKGQKTTKASCREYLEMGSANSADYHLNLLVKQKLFIVSKSKVDKRVKIVSLSKNVEKSMEKFLRIFHHRL